ncbi:hypothetical protein PSYJA_47313, partial [Pseudomonas syringae pv. japonica str. M301072]
MPGYYNPAERGQELNPEIAECPDRAGHYTCRCR